MYNDDESVIGQCNLEKKKRLRNIYERRCKKRHNSKCNNPMEEDK